MNSIRRRGPNNYYDTKRRCLVYNGDHGDDADDAYDGDDNDDDYQRAMSKWAGPDYKGR